ncbi:MAG TPA: Gfo/Idh/MocA family oxidoreductase [Gemmatimonadaceae bacterium]|nr:Gfo/Idh/MocA family oxidoreductase [Gemmatimonadaceae bacterium]
MSATLVGAASGLGQGASATRPRVGFLGAGWIGRHRLAAIAAEDVVDIVAVCDPSAEAVTESLRLAPGAGAAASLDELLALGLDAVVIATPSAAHAEQSIAALERGLAVFCQKPLARSADETRQVVEAARRADRLLGVDLSYRETRAMQAIRGLVRDGALGDVYAVDLVFHNAYGPDKPWFYDRALSGGGCVIDLGIHLVDLAMWTLDRSSVRGGTARLYAKGRPLAPGAVEDYAVATLDLVGDVTVRLACSWHLHAGEDAVIEATFHGSAGSASMRNVGGSFYDFAAYRQQGTRREPLVQPPDEWGGRAAAAWARQLAGHARYDASIERLIDVAGALDLIYREARA